MCFRLFIFLIWAFIYLYSHFFCNCHFAFLKLHKIPLCMYTSFSLSISGYCEWYNNKRRCLRVSLLCGLRLFGYIPRSAVVGSHSNSSFDLSFFFFKKASCIFPQWLYPFIFPLEVHSGCSFPTASWTFVGICSFCCLLLWW